MRTPETSPAVWCAAPLAAALGLGVLFASPFDNHSDGAKTITDDEIEEHVTYLASPELGGRDSPSRGQMLAAEYIAGIFAEAGLVYAADSAEAWKRTMGDDLPPEWSTSEAIEGEGSYLRPFQTRNLAIRNRSVTRPIPDECSLELVLEGQEPTTFEYGTSFVPVEGCDGDVRGELVFVGFGIQSKQHKYDDLKGKDLEGKIAVALEGEPRHKRKFDGPDVTAESSLWNKLDRLGKAGARGVVFVRRPPPDADDEAAASPLGYRTTRATWNPPSLDRPRGLGLPAIEVNLACASALLGEDLAAIAEKMDRSARPQKNTVEGRTVSFRARIEEGAVTLHNVVGLLPGTELADEVVVVGAHYDHIGVGPRGRIGYGADDNASGTSALLEMVGAFAAAKPRRSILFTAFSGEEDGLLGSKDIAGYPPVDAGRIVAMVNLDMVGRGDRSEVVAMGFAQNPDMKKVVDRAKRLSRTGVKKVSEINDRGLFQRSDHYSFHEKGIPAVFFFEGYPLEKNKDYHSFRDTADKIDMVKVTNTARLAFNTAWILANDDERLPAPR